MLKCTLEWKNLKNIYVGSRQVNQIVWFYLWIVKIQLNFFLSMKGTKRTFHYYSHQNVFLSICKHHLKSTLWQLKSFISHNGKTSTHSGTLWTIPLLGDLYRFQINSKTLRTPLHKGQQINSSVIYIVCIHKLQLLTC